MPGSSAAAAFKGSRCRTTSDGLLKATRAIVCTGRHYAETWNCHRSRLRDAFLYQLPVVIDHRGASADLVTGHRIGTATDPADTAALARALRAAATAGPARDGYQLRPPRPDHHVTDLSQQRIRRRPVLGGLINEYERAA